MSPQVVLSYQLSTICSRTDERGLRMTERNKRSEANGGCLGVKSRRRTWYTAKSIGEPCAGAEPVVSEWGNPTRGTLVTGR
jgi:hypothetical protein